MNQSADAREGESFLPDFCGLQIVFAVVIIAEMLAFVLVLAPAESSIGRWPDLGLVSLFVQWVALTGIAVLCLTRRWLAGLGDIAAATFAYLLVLGSSLLMSWLALVAARPLGVDLLLPPGWRDGFVLRSVLISAIVAGVSLRYFYVRQQWQRQVVAESRANLVALQARIRPHFLFNSLNTAASLTQSDPGLAEATIEDLAELFRAALADGIDGVSMAVELDMARRYLNIETLRLGERLRIEWQLGDLDLEAPVPPLIVQPLLENAVYHGIEPSPEGGCVVVRGARDGDTNRLEIDNPLPPASAAEPGRTGNRMALDNIRERLAGFYGRPNLLTSGSDGTRFRVTLLLPRDRSS